VNILVELFRFMRARRKFWMVPILVVMLLLGAHFRAERDRLARSLTSCPAFRSQGERTHLLIFPSF
jgi:hypothetical protein